jgi:hypothetical protein
MMKKPDYVNANEAAKMLNCTISNIRRRCIAGEFKGAIKCDCGSNRWLIPTKEVEGDKNASAVK